MSLTGQGPLNSFGWGTTTELALDQQASQVSASFGRVRELLSDSLYPPHEFTERIFLPGIFHTADLEWSEDKKRMFYQERKKYENLPESMVDELDRWRSSQWKAVQTMQAAIDALKPQSKAVLEAVGRFLGSIIVNVHLREILIYPLVRDNLPDGENLFASAVRQSRDLKALLRQLREVIARDVNGLDWLPIAEESERHWSSSWNREKNVILPLLATYFDMVRLPDLAMECSADPKDPVPAPSPAPSAKLNYGQQLVQLYEILTRYYLSSGSLQGIPITHQSPDWEYCDGFSALPTNACGSLDKFPVSHKSALSPREAHSPDDMDLPMASKVLEHPHFDKYVPFGAPTSAIERAHDTISEEARKLMEEQHQREKSETQQAITRAQKATYGPPVLQMVEEIPQMLSHGASVAKSVVQLAANSMHTDDTEGSFKKVEVNLALRNHGTHFEALSRDITPIGNHYLLVHFDVQQIHPSDYTLKVFGCVEKPSVWTLDELKKFCPEALIRQPLTMECSGNGRTKMQPRFNHHVPWEFQAFGCYIWGGMPLRLLLQAVGVDRSRAVDVIFTGYDSGIQEHSLRHYQRAVGINDPILDFMMVVWENNGSPLLKEHGFPIRILTPGWYGDNNVKWLRSIEVVDYKFKGRHMVSYSYTAKHWDMDLSVPSQEIRPRAMLLPPGYPSFMDRSRYLLAGTHAFVGKAWVGGFYRAVTVVEVSVDNAKTWKRAKLGPRLGIFSWHNFSIELDLSVGVYKVFVRATDSMGHQQRASLGPADWNWHGMCDDACQTFELFVVDSMTYTI